MNATATEKPQTKKQKPKVNWERLGVTFIGAFAQGLAIAGSSLLVSTIANATRSHGSSNEHDNVVSLRKVD